MTCAGCGNVIAPGDELETWTHFTPDSECLDCRPGTRAPDADIRIPVSPDPYPYVQRKFVSSGAGSWAGDVLTINLGEDRAAVGGVRAVVQIPVQSAREWPERVTYGINRALVDEALPNKNP